MSDLAVRSLPFYLRDDGRLECETDYSLVRHFAKICGGPEWRKALLSAFTCYFDASGTQHDQVALAVGGFMSTAERWLEFETEWKRRLAKDGLEYFHRKEIRPERHPGLLDDLAKIIGDYAMRKFGMVVRVRELHRLVSKSILNKWHLDAYSYAGRACAAHVRLWAMENHLRSMPRIVYATGDAGRNQLEKRLRIDGINGVAFESPWDQENRKTGMIDPGAIPLQAADLFAYELFNPTRILEESKQPADKDLLSDVWYILDKIEGEAQITSVDNFDQFEKRIRQFFSQG